MTEQFSNNAETTLNGDITSGATTLIVTSATGFPTSGNFRIIIKAEGANTDEICTVTSVSGTTFTISRASEATAGVQTASAHTSGAVVAHILTAGAIRAANLAFIGCRAYATATQAITAGATISVALTAEEFDTDGFHDNSTNNERMTIPTGLGGKYLIAYHVNAPSDAATSPQIATWLRVNGTSLRGSQGGSNAVSTNDLEGLDIHVALIADLAAGDYVDIQAYSANAVSIGHASAVLHTTLQIVKLDTGKLGAGIGARVYNAATQSISNTTSTVTIFDTEDFDTDGFHSISSNTGRMTIPTGLGGKYILKATGSFALNSTGLREQWFRLNGSNLIKGSYIAISAPSASERLAFPSISIINLNAGDYVEFLVWQSSTASLNFGDASQAEWQATFEIARLDSSSPTLTIQSEDQSFNASGNTLRFPNSSMTQNNDGSISVRGVVQGFIGAKVYSSATTSVTNTTFTAIAFAAEEFDTDGFHDTVTNNSRITIPAGLGGKYLANIEVEWDSNTTGERIATLAKNGSGDTGNGWERDNIVNANGLTRSHSAVISVVPGDYLEVLVYQSSGTTRTAGGNNRTFLSLIKLDSGNIGQGIGARAYNSGSQTYTSSSSVAATLDSEEYDTDGFHSTTSNTSRMTIPTGLGGKYVLRAKGYWNTAWSTFALQVSSWKKNGTTVTGTIVRESVGRQGGADAEVSIQNTTILSLAAGDYVEWFVQQNSGSNKDLGTNTGYETVVEIARLDSGTGQYTGAKWGSGTAFPSGPATNDRFTRTDRNIDYYYDGTQWLTTTLYELPLGVSDILDAGTATYSKFVALPQEYAVYLISANVSAIVAGTNNGSNYWTFQFKTKTTPNTDTNRGSAVDTSGDAGSTYVNKKVTLGITLTTSEMGFLCTATKTGSPSGLYMFPVVQYRLIGT